MSLAAEEPASTQHQHSKDVQRMREPCESTAHARAARESRESPSTAHAIHSQHSTRAATRLGVDAPPALTLGLRARMVVQVCACSNHSTSPPPLTPAPTAPGCGAATRGSACRRRRARWRWRAALRASSLTWLCCLDLRWVSRGGQRRDRRGRGGAGLDASGRCTGPRYVSCEGQGKDKRTGGYTYAYIYIYVYRRIGGQDRIGEGEGGVGVCWLVGRCAEGTGPCWVSRTGAEWCSRAELWDGLVSV